MDPDGERYPLQAAAEYAALGLAVLAECPPHCSWWCRSPGKRPYDPIRGGHLKGWQTQGVPSPDELAAWMRTLFAKVLNIGARCGPNCLGVDGLIGADADGERGIAELATHVGGAAVVLQAALAGYLESGTFTLNLGTAAYVTQSGGLRILWRVAPGADLRTVGGDKGHDGLRLMWQGSQVVLPPSIGPKGIYRWLPGHAPAQIGFAPAPASVLAAMAPRGKRAARAAEKARADALWAALPPEARGEVRPSIAFADAYPAAIGNLGPDQSGRLVDAGRLPYNLKLLRDGVPQGQRSEAVRRLELQMLAAGWTVEQVVAALAGQPWIAAMRPNIIAWLTADVLRATAWRAERDSATLDAPSSLWTPRAYRRGTETDSGTGPVSGTPAREDAEPGTRGEAVASTTESAGPSPNTDGDAGLDGGAGSPPPSGGAGSPGDASWDRYDRRDHGTRLRSYDRERDEAVRRGLETIRDFLAGLAHPDKAQQRLLEHCGRLLGSYDRCRTEAWGHPHDLREQERRAAAGGAWLWGHQPCDGRGHEDCAPFHAARELRTQWGATLDEVYGHTPVVVLALSAPGWGLDPTHKAASGLLREAKVQRALGLCAGFLSFEPGAAPGYVFHVVVPAHRADERRVLLLKVWRERVPCGWVRVLDDLPPRCTALEALVELRVRSEQAILVALGRGEVGCDEAIRFYAVETGAFSDSEVGGQKHRLVLAPGMRKLAKDIREGRARLAAAAGDGSAEGAGMVGGLGAQGGAGTTPTIEGMGTAGAIPSNSGADPGSPSAAGTSGASAGPEQGSSGTGSPPDDDGGWVPCPWDPTLEMRPSRDPHMARALPWWKLQKMAKRGEVVPIVHNGRVIGYRTPPTRGPRG